MIGWYHSEVDVSKPNMETLRSDGKVSLYKRIIGNSAPYALYKENNLVANITELRLAEIEYNALIASMQAKCA